MAGEIYNKGYDYFAVSCKIYHTSFYKQCYATEKKIPGFVVSHDEIISSLQHGLKSCLILHQ